MVGGEAESAHNPARLGPLDPAHMRLMPLGFGRYLNVKRKYTNFIKGGQNMIGPVFLRGELINKFKEHLINTEYHYVIHSGIANINSIAERFKFEKLDDLLDKFIGSDYPIVCKSGSKSAIPFWDYHVAVNSSRYDNEVVVTELLIREPKDSYMTKGVLMAFYMLINDRYKFERLIVPIKMTEIIGYEDIGIVSKNDETILFRKHS